MASKINVDKIARGSGTPEFTIPTADGTAGQFLKTDGSGVLAFDTVTTTALTGSTNNTIPTVTGANALAGEANFTYDGNTLDIKNAGTASSIKLYCETSNQHYQEIKAAPHSGSSNWTLTLPPNDGAANEFLQTNGSGVTTWAVAGGDNTPAFMATIGGSAQSIADSTNTKVEMSVEVFDTDNTYDPTTNYRWTPGVVGKYHIGFSVYMEGDTIHREWVKIYKNGSLSLPQTFTQAYTGGGYHPDRSTQANSALIDVTDVADYFEVWTWIDTDNGSSTPVQDALLTFFWGYKVIT